MHRSADAQLERKRAAVERAVGRAVDAVVPSPRALGYRARVSLQPGPDGRLGYHRPRSHAHVAVPRCAIARPEINDALGALAEVDWRPVRRLELRSDGQAVVLSALSGRDRRAARALCQRLPLPTALDGRPVVGDPTVRLEVAGIRHALSPASFYQVNLELNALLVERVGALIRALEPAAVLDLYAGAGNLSLPLAATGVQVTLLESEGSAIRDAERTVAEHGLLATIRRGDAGKLAPGDHFFDVALLDPPRAGAPGVLRALTATRPRAILYVSCNPQTLARDLRSIQGQGYGITRLEALDMFPQTPHVEALCLLQRG